MSITKRTEEQIDILPSGIFQVKEITIVEETIGEVTTELSRSFHRRVVDVGSDVSSETTRLQAVSAATWTQDVIDARAAEIAAAE